MYCLTSFSFNGSWAESTVLVASHFHPGLCASKTIWHADTRSIIMSLSLPLPVLNSCDSLEDSMSFVFFKYSTKSERLGGTPSHFLVAALIFLCLRFLVYRCPILLRHFLLFRRTVCLAEHILQYIFKHLNLEPKTHITYKKRTKRSQLMCSNNIMKFHTLRKRKLFRVLEV